MTTSLGTQTDLNIELILNFVANDLPRVVSFELVPLLLKFLTQPRADERDMKKSLQSQIQIAITNILRESLPWSAEAIKPAIIDVAEVDDYRKRKRTDPVIVSMELKPICEICGKRFTIFQELCDHYREMHGSNVSNTKILYCPMCDYNSSNITGFAHHIEESHVKVTPAQRRYRDMVCGWEGTCNRTFRSTQRLQKHREDQHGDMPKCPKCNVIFEYKGQLASHLKYSIKCGSEVDRNQTSQKSVSQPVVTTSHPSLLTTSQSSTSLEAGDSVGTAPGGSVSTQGRDLTASLVGNALLAALDTPTTTPTAAVADTATSSTTSIEMGQPLSLTPQTVLTTSTTTTKPKIAACIEKDLIMDVETGVPIPIPQYINKRRADMALNAAVKNTGIAVNVGRTGKTKCLYCNRQFSSRGVLRSHVQKDHAQIRKLSCTKCYLLFATFEQLDSHYHRVHRQNKKKQPPTKKQQENSNTENDAVIICEPVDTDKVDKDPVIICDTVDADKLENDPVIICETVDSDKTENDAVIMCETEHTDEGEIKKRRSRRKVERNNL